MKQMNVIIILGFTYIVIIAEGLVNVVTNCSETYKHYVKVQGD